MSQIDAENANFCQTFDRLVDSNVKTVQQRKNSLSGWLLFCLLHMASKTPQIAKNERKTRF